MNPLEEFGWSPIPARHKQKIHIWTKCLIRITICEYLSIQSTIVHMIDKVAAQHLADLFSALSDPTRLQILSLLLETEHTVGAIAEQVELTDSGVSHQLSRLRLQHIVRARKEGRQVYYRLDDEHVAGLIQQSLKHVEHL
jgi:ArsR family transcriptional regulator, zinc-responsive transcriptional repressor